MNRPEPDTLRHRHVRLITMACDSYTAMPQAFGFRNTIEILLRHITLCAKSPGAIRLLQPVPEQVATPCPCSYELLVTSEDQALGQRSAVRAGAMFNGYLGPLTVSALWKPHLRPSKPWLEKVRSFLCRFPIQGFRPAISDRIRFK